MAEQEILVVEPADIDLVAVIWNHALNNSPFETAVTSAAQLIAAHRLAATKAADERVATLEEALRPFAEAHPMGDNYVQFAPRLIQAARAALAEAGGRGG